VAFYSWSSKAAGQRPLVVTELSMRGVWMMNILPNIVQSLDVDPRVYRTAEPFPHIVIDNFLPTSVLSELVSDFPAPDSDIWNERIKELNQLKLASNEVDLAPPRIRDVLYQLNSATTLRAMEKLTGEGPLISDPFFEGGGLHQIEPGGFLSIHSDFTRPRHLPIYRRLNLLLYLNENWDESFGGKLELWTRDGKEKAKEILPIANRAVIFTTDTTSFHGHPTPLQCPAGRSRRSLALYYYSVEPPARDHTGTATRWKRETHLTSKGLRGQVAETLWRVSRRIGSIASQWETSALRHQR
jgi:hypothetical protein